MLYGPGDITEENISFTILKYFQDYITNVHCHKDSVRLLKQLKWIVLPIQYQDQIGKIKGMLFLKRCLKSELKSYLKTKLQALAHFEPTFMVILPINLTPVKYIEVYSPRNCLS